MISLYIKIHNITGLKYFGKTVRNPLKYNGSGKYWARHLKIHGVDLTTVIVGQFTSQDECSAAALKFSKDHDIVASDEWANLREETGTDGAPVGHPGHVFTKDQLIQLSSISKDKWKDEAFRNKVSASQKSSWTSTRKDEQSKKSIEFWTEERRKNHSEIMKLRVSERPSFVLAFEEYVKQPRTEKHKQGISKALSGKSKSKEHRLNLAWTKIKAFSPNLPFESYLQFATKCQELSEQGMIRYHIAKELKVSHRTVTKALEYLEDKE